MLNSGVWLTFFAEGESSDRELPALGPFDGVVFGREKLIVTRREVRHDEEDAAERGGMRWLAAELELKRALGEIEATARRFSARVSRPDGVPLFLRFGDYGARDPGPAELGPYREIVVGPERVSADGTVIAVRSLEGRWRLGAASGAAEGTERPDVAVRHEGAAYRPFREASARVAAVASAGAEAARTATPAAEPQIYEARYSHPTVAPAAEEIEEEEAYDEAPDRRRLILLALGVLVVAALGGILWQLVLEKGGPGQAPAVAVGAPVTGAEYDYRVASFQRTGAIGPARSNGVFLIVHVVMTNRHATGPLQPSSFSLVDGAGHAYSPQPPGTDVYQSSANPAGAAWPASFPPDTEVEGDVVFDVPEAATGLRLVLPGTTTEVRILG